MIWAVVTKDEMQACQTSPVFGFYQEALGKNNIQLAIVEEDTHLDFVTPDDSILLRTYNKKLVHTIEAKSIKSTGEDYDTYKLVLDKKTIAEFLKNNSIQVPRQYSIGEIDSSKVYFVKPRYGSDSIGITAQCICHGKDEVLAQVSWFKKDLHLDTIIEDFIDGVDLTVACCNSGSELKIAPIGIECNETQGIQTRECKVGFKEYCYPLIGEQSILVTETAKKVFSLLGLKHHARIDFRLGVNGELYVIDVNLLPGLGPIDHFAKCFLLSHNYSYIDTIRMVVNATS